MMAIDLAHDQATLRDRLIQSADDELAECGTLTGRFEAIARRAGVSRATAYRQIGSVSELLTQVGLRRSRKYIVGLCEVMERENSTLRKLEEAIIYGTQVLPTEPIVMELIARQFTRGRDPELYGMINDAVRPVMLAGQRSGDIRNDVDLELVVDFLVEQSYLSTRAPDKSANAVRQRFHVFVVPAIVPQTGN